MIKKIFAVFAAFMIVLGLCACNSETPAGGETTVDTTPLVETSEEQTQVSKYPELMDYADYIKLTPAQQQEYYESFPDQESYMQWFNDAATQHKQEQANGQNGNDGVGQLTEPTQTQQEQPSQQTEEPTQTTTGSSEKKDPVLLTYAEYLKLTPAQQQAYYESFPTPQAYMNWFNAAAKEYNKNSNDTQVDSNVGQVTQPTENDGDVEQQEQPTSSNEKTDSDQLDGVGFIDMNSPTPPKR